MNEPLPTVIDGRNLAGQFTKGNRFGRGNGLQRRVQRLRVELLRTITPADLRDIILSLMAGAKSGDVAAAKEILQRVLGPAESLDLLIRLENLENELHERPNYGSKKSH